ncbi:uncharacterized protein BDR25DRAFT_314315 [Lindgomyces ingoldianus]|uniref:Uncharacterized protein n=1 Tax=Lindgomyces ingoldianus TaxID=673940 RepID=A0ACB6QUQ3_9PLEO|nr:uncharacterized protein BDR25DRAFT_314315 [Lindgomyces ingoldianus]KAF2470597.1 hypothetical protein BDR25DRAFT_314315 [Lindgomyces ingoldianus]
MYQTLNKSSHVHRGEPSQTSLSSSLPVLDYLYNEEKLVHTEIRADNILIPIPDKPILESFIKVEMDTPSSSKFVNCTPISASRTFETPKRIGRKLLRYFRAATRGDVIRNCDAQPDSCGRQKACCRLNRVIQSTLGMSAT